MATRYNAELLGVPFPSRFRLLIAVVGFGIIGAGAWTAYRRFDTPKPIPFPTSAQTLASRDGAIRVVPVVDGLTSPWSVAFLPGGDMLVTERVGRLRLVQNGVLHPNPIAGTPAVFANNQGGLLDVVLHPDFADNKLVYFTYAISGDRGNTAALGRGRLDGHALASVEQLFVADAWSRTEERHFGSRLAFATDGTLFMTVGERNDRHRAQNTFDHAGKVLRLNDDGSVPADNPFAERLDVRPEIFSYGHRNPQAVTRHPLTGAIWATEHGPKGGDELNLILPARNYGWPVVTFGVEYSGLSISPDSARNGLQSPATHWTPSIALSGMDFYTGDRFPTWRGDLLVTGLSGKRVERVRLTNGVAEKQETLLTELGLRMRDVREGPDGFVYVITDGSGAGILRIEPVNGGR